MLGKRSPRLIAVLCISSACVTHDIVREPECLRVPIVIQLDGPVTHTGCSQPNGQFKIRVAGGGSTYSVFLNGTDVGQQTTFAYLASGKHIVVVEEQGCLDSLVVHVNNLESSLKVDVTTIADDDCTGANGMAVLHLTGGHPPYSKYLDGQITARDSITALETGGHTIVVIDAAGCSVQSSFTVPRGPSGISWEMDIMPIIHTWCAKAGCHVSGTGRIDLTRFNNVKTHAMQIKTRTLNGSMPYDNLMPEEYIMMIACWVDDGAPFN